MTMPYERKNAVERTEDFLFRLIDPKQTPRIPSEIRREARALLKHYPAKFYMEQTAKELPEIWGGQ